MTSGRGTGTAMESIAPSVDCRTACNVVPAFAARRADPLDDVTPLADDRLEERVVDRLRQGGSALVEEGRRFLCKLSARDLLDCRELHELAASRSTCASAGK